MMLIYEPGDRVGGRTSDDTASHFGAWRAYYRALVDAGVYVTGAPLQPDPSRTTVRVRDGQRQVQDGPYADTKEQLGGAIVLELRSLDAALEWASRCPAASYGAVEIRPISEHVREAVECAGG